MFITVNDHSSKSNVSWLKYLRDVCVRARDVCMYVCTCAWARAVIQCQDNHQVSMHAGVQCTRVHPAAITLGTSRSSQIAVSLEHST